MPALRSPAPRPQTAPSTIGAAERILALGARPVLPPAVDMNGVGMADEEQPPAAAGALRSPQTFGRPGRNSALTTLSTARARAYLAKIGDDIAFMAGDAFLPDRALEQRQRTRRDRAHCAVEPRGRWRAWSATASRGDQAAGGSEMRLSGASSAEQGVVQLVEPDGGRADDARRGRRARWPRHRPGRENIAADSACTRVEKLRAQPDRAAEDHLLRIGDRADGPYAAGEQAGRLVDDGDRCGVAVLSEFEDDRYGDLLARCRPVALNDAVRADNALESARTAGLRGRTDHRQSAGSQAPRRHCPRP